MDAVIVGAGFTGLAAALRLAREGYKVRVVDQDQEPGGLAGSFRIGDERLEKFYHHWFTSDTHIMELIASLGREDRILKRPTRTGMYYAHRFYRLSGPKDVLSFTPLSFLNRLRLGYVALAALVAGAHAAGARAVNLGASTGLPGVAMFKRRFGSVDVPVLEQRSARYLPVIARNATVRAVNRWRR